MPSTRSLKPARKADPERKIPYEEFLATPEYEGLHAEWVDGKVFVMTPASSRHQRIAKFLLLVLESYLEARPGGEVSIPPFQMKTGPTLPGREPDLLYVAKEHLDRVKQNHLDGPADLVVEIASAESRKRDREEKFAEYAQGGVREYWLIDPDRERAEFHRLAEDGAYNLIPLSADGLFRSAVLDGFWLKVDWLWQDPLPEPLAVARELGLV